jgi:phosphoribosylglycinamide formyltransferase-1
MVLKLAVLISGRGTNLAAIQSAIEAGRCAARVELVVSDRSGASGLAFATERGLRSAVVPFRDYPDRANWDLALAETVADSGAQLVVLAGFMRVVGTSFLARFPRRTINVHPALLPLFAGTHGPADALAAGVRISGCTVHLVDAGVDTGPIIAQAAVPVLPNDSVETLKERIQAAEHHLLPRVIDAIAGGQIELTPALRIHGSSERCSMLLSPPLLDGTA